MVIKLCIALNLVIICLGFQMPDSFTQMCRIANTTAVLLFLFADMW